MRSVAVVANTFNPAESYGRVARELVAGLEYLGLRVATAERGVAVRDVRVMPAGGFILGYPTGEVPETAQIGTRMLVTMFEADQIPARWVEPANSMDAIIVPSEFLIPVFRRAGVTVPMYVNPLGVSDGFFAPVKRERSTPLTFLTIGDRGERKGWWDAIKAFRAAFGDDPGYRLIIKARKFRFDISSMTNVEVVEGDYSDEDMLALYQRAHVMIFPTKGEGFGLPPREFAATGGIALATAWSGTADNLRWWGVPIPVKGFAPAFRDAHAEIQVGQWAMPDVDALTALLRDVDKRFDYHAAQAMSAARFVERHYRWQAFANRAWESYQEMEAVRYGRKSKNERVREAASEPAHARA